MNPSRFLLLAVVAVALGACAGVTRVPVGSAEAQVRAALGEPALVLPDPAGGRHLAYPRGPLGTETFMARLGPDGRLVALEQVLNEDHIARIRQGVTTEEDLLRLIGPPWRRVEFANLRQVAWDYRFLDAWGYLADLSVMVDERRVVAGTVVVRIDPRSGGGRD
jgi:outer membrane protein assembly factor BamE (lipoprotein component of BamABCDE complex)